MSIMKTNLHSDYGYPEHVRVSVLEWCFKHGVDSYVGPISKKTILTWIRRIK